MSTHHYCLLLNRDGKPPEQFESYSRAALKNPGYRVLRHDRHAHAAVFDGGDAENDVYSYIVYNGDESLGLPYVASANKRMNLMMQLNAAIRDNVLSFTTRNGVTDTFVLSVAE